MAWQRNKINVMPGNTTKLKKKKQKKNLKIKRKEIKKNAFEALET